MLRQPAVSAKLQPPRKRAARIPLRVLLIEDSEEDALLLQHELQRGGYEPAVERVLTESDMSAALDHPFDLVIADYTMPNFSGTAALRLLRQRGFDTPFIFVSGTITEDTAVATMRAGAQDYVLKGNLKRLAPAVERELRDARERQRAADAHRRLQDQIHQMQKMDAIGRLAGAVAHDFNNILTVVIADAQMLLMSLPEDSQLRETVSEIKQAADRATALTRQLLSFSRNQEHEPTVCDLNQVVSNVDQMVRRLLGETIDVRIQTDPTLGTVTADPGRLEQVLFNLAVNARDAMPDGGKLIIETANTRLDEEYALTHPGARPGEHAMLAVSDTGTGMSPEVQAHMFEPFFTTKESGKGNGIGLATCYGIVRQFGGHIGVYSEEGVGTTMRVYLPRADQPAASRADPAPKQAAAAGAGTGAGAGAETVLLVDDAAPVRRTARRMLAAAGYTVLEAGSGPEALDLLRRHRDRVDLLLTDVVLPGMGAKELAERVRALRPGIKVLCASGYSDAAAREQELLPPATQLLQKPFTREELTGKVREVLNTP